MYSSFPFKVFEKDGTFYGWRVQATEAKYNNLYGVSSGVLFKTALDFAQSLAHLGFTLRKADHHHTLGKVHNIFFVLLQSYFFDTSLVMVKSKNAYNRYEETKFLMIRPIVFFRRNEIHLIGNFDQALFSGLASSLESFSVIDEHGNHIMWKLEIKGFKYGSFKFENIKRIENITQNFILQIMDELTKFGFQYGTIYGKNHIFIKTVSSISFLT